MRELRLRIARQATLYALAQALTALPPFLMIPIMTRHLSNADYGLVALFSVSVTLLHPLIGLGIGRLAPVWRLHLQPAELSRRLASALAIAAISAGLFGAGFLLLRVIADEVLGVPVFLLGLAALSHGPQALVAARLGLWQADGQSVRFGMLQVMSAILNVAVSIILVVMLGWQWEGRVTGHLAGICAGGLVAAISLSAVTRRCGMPRRVELVGTARTEILPLLPYGIGVALLAVSDRVFAANWLELGEVGLYGAASQMAVPILLLGEVSNRALSPWLIERLRGGDSASYRTSWRAIGAAAGVIGVATAGLGGALFMLSDWLLGPSFHGALMILPYLLVANATGMIAMLTSTYLLAAGRMALLSGAMVAALLGLGIVCGLFAQDMTPIRLAQCFALANLFLLLLIVGLTLWSYATKLLEGGAAIQARGPISARTTFTHQVLPPVIEE